MAKKEEVSYLAANKFAYLAFAKLDLIPPYVAAEITTRRLRLFLVSLGSLFGAHKFGQLCS